MPKKKKWQHRMAVWTPLVRATIPPEEMALVQRQTGVDDATMAECLQGEVWKNDRYQVLKRVLGNGPAVMLSIRRLDRQPIRDWRDMQAIKDQLVGAECEGVELYPAASRLVDTANQYWLWCVADPTFRFPFGFSERLVMEDVPGKAKQRPFPS